MFLFYFLPVTLILYYIAPKAIKNLVLLLASLVEKFSSDRPCFDRKNSSVLLEWAYGGKLMEKTEITLEYRYRAYYLDSVIAREYSYEIVSLINEMSNNYEAKFHK